MRKASLIFTTNKNKSISSILKIFKKKKEKKIIYASKNKLHSTTNMSFMGKNVSFYAAILSHNYLPQGNGYRVTDYKILYLY